MRKKIILGIVILAAVILLFNNFAVVETVVHGKQIAYTNAAKITWKFNISRDEEMVYFTPKLKKFKKLERLFIAVDDDADYKYLSQMNDLQELTIFYCFSYCGPLETLPELPNLKKLTLTGGVDGSNFTLSDEYEYNFASIETLEISFFKTIDCDALKHFENLHTLRISALKNDLTEEQVGELQSRGINVEIK